MIKFSENSDGSGMNFEVYLTNVGSAIYENGVQKVSQSSQYYFDRSRFETFVITWTNGTVFVNHNFPVM
jgi:hypothetical protein